MSKKNAIVNRTNKGVGVIMSSNCNRKYTYDTTKKKNVNERKATC